MAGIGMTKRDSLKMRLRNLGSSVGMGVAELASGALGEIEDLEKQLTAAWNLHRVEQARADRLEQKRDRLLEALKGYMSQFGQALEAHGIPFGPAQLEADAEARSAIADFELAAGRRRPEEGAAPEPAGSAPGREEVADRSDTPRTDVFLASIEPQRLEYKVLGLMGFARILERELASEEAGHGDLSLCPCIDPQNCTDARCGGEVMHGYLCRAAVARHKAIHGDVPPKMDVPDDRAAVHALVQAFGLLRRVRDKVDAVKFFEANAVMGMIEDALPKSMKAVDSAPVRSPCQHLWSVSSPAECLYCGAKKGDRRT